MASREPQPTDAPSRTLWWLLEGSRGGPTRRRLLAELRAHPQNAHQLSTTLDLDYKTVEHHLATLIEHGMLIRIGSRYGAIFFVSPAVEAHPELLVEPTGHPNGRRRSR